MDHSLEDFSLRQTGAVTLSLEKHSKSQVSVHGTGGWLVSYLGINEVAMIPISSLWYTLSALTHHHLKFLPPLGGTR